MSTTVQGITEERKKFGARLKAYREKKNLSQKKIAHILGMKSPQFISNCERGVALPPLPMLGALAKPYGITKDGLLDAFMVVKRVEFQKRIHSPFRLSTQSRKANKGKTKKRRH